MILDSSAFIAVPRRQAGCARFATPLETAIVAERQGGEGAGAGLDALIERLDVNAVPSRAEHAALAREAWPRVGEGRHPAGLEPGERVSDAPAKARHQTLLFQGADFSRTDVRAAL